MKGTCVVEPENLAPFFGLLVEKIGCGSQDAVHELRVHFLRGIQYLLTRSLGGDRAEELSDRVLEQVVEAIRNGEVSEPERLPSFVQAIVHRTIASETELRPRPVAALVSREDFISADRILRALPPRDKEILIRFYCLKQQADQICREMRVTTGEVRGIKKRAKSRFAQHEL